MSSFAREALTLLVTLALVASGTVALAGATAVAADDTQRPAVSESVDQTATDQQAGDADCAAEPPDDHGDPESDVLGWENGYWYDESLDVDQSDGVNVSEQRAIVNRTMARVEAVRCVEFDEAPPVNVVDRQEYVQMEEEGELTLVELTPELRAFDNAKFEALFLVPETEDSLEVQRDNRGTAVLGFYSPEEGEIFVIAEDRETLRIDEITLAHELMHAWQDQEHDLSSDEFTPGLRDEANARSGLVEGDASYVDTLYERRCDEGAWNGTCLRPGDGPQGAAELRNMGVYLLNFQPYSDGPAFVRFARTVGGWDAVDGLYDRPPASTEQVIHVEKYGQEEPRDLAFEDRTGEDWERVTVPGRPDYGSVGEAGLLSTFAYPFYHSEGADRIIPPDEWLNFDETGNTSEFDPLDYRSNYTEGWDGDRLHVYENESNETAYVWRIAWDSPQDAAQFLAGYQRVLEYWGGESVGQGTFVIDEGGFADAFHVSAEGTTVTIVNAPTVDQLSEVRTDVQIDAPDGAMATDDESAANGGTAADNETAAG